MSPQAAMAWAPYAARLATDWDRRTAGAQWLVADGSLAKVDLSGFTRLSERLARSEVTGAEGLNTVLNDVFLSLIEEVLARGGDVLQFGGDALTVWFEGPQHQVRAVAACLAMQRRVGERPAEQTVAGPVRLRMSAGVSSGSLVLTVVGHDHRELLTLGPVASRVELMEKLARSGEVLVDAATAERLPAGGVRPAGAGAWRCVGRPREIPVPRAVPLRDGAEAFVPPDVRVLGAVGGAVGEHRHAAVAFIGVSGIDASITSGDVSAAVHAVVQVADAVDHAVSATGVAWTATDLMGDGAVFLLFAGAPVAREDDAERMLRACRVVLEADLGPGVRIGAHAGRVFSADIGHPERRTYAVIGDTTNLAARLMHRAQPGTALVTDELFARSDRDHVVQWSDAFTVRGRRRPVTAGVLGPRTQVSVRRRTHDLPLIGREAERSRLSALMHALTGGVPAGDRMLRLALVADAGAGKSRLVEDVVTQVAARGARLVQAAATALEADIPYAALRPALRAALGVGGEPPAAAARLRELTAQFPGLMPLLGLPLGLEFGSTPQVEALDPRFIAARRNDLLAEVLLAATAQPLLVVVEDLHDLDQASAGLVDLLAQRAAPGVLALVVTSRTPLGNSLHDDQRWDVIDLPAIQPEQARQLALTFAGDLPLSDAELTRLVSESGGNPLFLRELVALPPSATESSPTSADAVVAARIDTLDPVRRRLLREASVAGPVQRLADLAAVLDDITVADPARWAGLSDFVVVESAAPALGGGAQLRFRHDLYRLGAYRGLAVRRRRVLHAALAHHLIYGRDSAAAAARIAVHLHEAQQFEQAWEWALQAAHTARSNGALHDAASLFVRAIDAGARAGVAASVLAHAHEELGDVTELVGRYQEADDALRSAARLGNAVDVGRRLVKRATVLERCGRYRQSLGTLTRAERLIRDEWRETEHTNSSGSPHSDRAALALRRSSVLHRLGRLRLAFDVAAQVAAIEPQVTSPLAHGDRARALLRLEMLASEAGWPERFELGERALAAFDGLDEDRDLACLLGNLGVTAWESDDWVAARRRYEEAAAVYRRAGDVVGAAIAANNAGEILCEQGYLAEAKDVFLDARRIFRAAGHTFGVACTVSSLGRVAARSGEPEAAMSLLEEACTSLTAMGSTSFVKDARVRQVEAALLVGDPESLRLAHHLLREISSSEAGAVLPVVAARYLAIATVAGGDVVEGARLARSALERAVASNTAHEESLALDVLAGLDVLQGRTPSPQVLRRRDHLWQRLGVVAPPGFRAIPRA